MVDEKRPLAAEPVGPAEDVLVHAAQELEGPCSAAKKRIHALALEI